MSNFLNGKLTYILGFAAIGWGVLGIMQGWTSAGDAMPVIWTGLAALGIRRAISNI